MMKIKIYWLFIAVLLFSSCHSDVPSENDDQVFQIIKRDRSGLTFSNDLKETLELNIVEYLYYYNGGGVGIGDINGDGLEDVFLTANQGFDKLFVNKGGLSFEEAKNSGILTDETWSTGVSIDDINGDGYLDIYVCKVAPHHPKKEVHNLLYINKGNGDFIEKATDFGLDFRGYSTQACFFDYDLDGDLDMYLLNHTVHSISTYGNIDKRQEVDSIGGDRLYENRIKEEGKFVNVSVEAGIYSTPLGYGLAVTTADINGDGYPDIYVGNDFHENDYLYINNGDGTFKERIADYMGHTTQFSMGVDVADIDGDGRLDIYSTDMMPFDEEVLLTSAGEDTDEIKRIKRDFGYHPQQARNHLQLQQKNGRFAEVAHFTRTFASDWSWAPLLQDFDNNGLIDIFITNGIVRRPNDLDYINFINSNNEDLQYTELIERIPPQPLKNILYRQNSKLQFSHVNESLVGEPSFSNGAAYADLDLDGDLDVITNNINQDAFLYENTSDHDYRFLEVNLKSDSPSKTVKGSTVYLYFADQPMMRTYRTTRGYQSSSSHYLHFGWNNDSEPDSLIVGWSDGSKEKIVDLTLDQLMEIQKGKNEIFPSSRIHNSIRSPEVLPIAHQDNVFYDENREKLIPMRMSHLGPALIAEDLNGDGIKDLFIGGGRNQASRLLLGNGKGGFNAASISGFEQDAKYEDVDAATIDFDGDGDRDLYVVSGGNEFNESDKLNEDRLYLNNGGGIFRRIPISLPHTNGSCVAVSDFDQDGFEDLFIGAATIPSFYGLSPYSFLLRNKEGQAIEIADQKRYGMVMDAAWADLEDDGYPDLLVAGHWMPVLAFTNDNGVVSKEISEVGINSGYGFWNNITVTDLNKDGKDDLLLGNIGNNSRWVANETNPIYLYLGDYDDNGFIDPIIMQYYQDRYIPLGGLSKLSTQVPSFRKTFPSFSSFKNVDNIDLLIPDEKEKRVEYKKVDQLQSLAIISTDNGFENRLLPMEAQFSSINDFLYKDSCIYYVGNNKQMVADLGNIVANSGGILKMANQKSVQFESIQTQIIPGFAQAMKIRLLDENKMLIAINNGYPYLINVRQ